MVFSSMVSSLVGGGHKKAERQQQQQQQQRRESMEDDQNKHLGDNGDDDDVDDFDAGGPTPAHHDMPVDKKYQHEQRDDWLCGQLNHLTPDQSKAFDQFKKNLEKEGLYSPAIDGVQPASHDDSTLLRFLRARRFVVSDGIKQFSETEKWRKTNKIEALYENIEIDPYEDARRMYPQWTGRRDRRGIPIYVFEIKNLNQKNMAAYIERTKHEVTSATHNDSEIPAHLLRLFALYENMTQFVTPLCSSLPRPHPEAPVVSTTNIVDVSGVGLKQFWNLKSHMQNASVLATAHYPETLDRIFIIGAPAFFPTVWSWIKRWFDPVTTSKIFILSASEVKPTLTHFMDPSSFPKKYGGELDWEWQGMPNLDEPARNLVGALERVDPDSGQDNVLSTPVSSSSSPPSSTSFIKGPVKWLGDRISIFGSKKGESRRREIVVPATAAPSGENPQQLSVDSDTPGAFPQDA